jgi:LacI family transcriptional regulator
MQVSIADLGDKAMTRLLQLMDGNNTEAAGDKQTLVPRLIVRDSCRSRPMVVTPLL